MSRSGKRLTTEEKQRRRIIRQKRLSKNHKPVRYHKIVPPEYTEIDVVLREHISEFIRSRLSQLDRYHNTTTYPSMYYKYTTISVIMTATHTPPYTHYVSCHIDEPNYNFSNGNVCVTMGIRHDFVSETVPKHSSQYEEFNGVIAKPTFFEELDVFMERNWQLYLKDINVKPS